MSLALSNYEATNIMNALLRGQSFTAPSTLYVALLTTAATASDTGTSIINTVTSHVGGTGQEVTTTATAYGRQSITCNTSNWIAPAVGTTIAGSVYVESQTVNAVSYATATATFGTIVGVALCDSTITTTSSLTFTNGSPTFNIASTTGYHAGDPIALTDGTNWLYTTILSLVTNTSITLNANWSFSTTASGTAYDGGNIIYYGSLVSNQTISNTQTASFAAGNLVVGMQ